MILSTVIDGPHAPGNDIYVYLQPLIDDLNHCGLVLPLMTYQTITCFKCVQHCFGKLVIFQGYLTYQDMV